MPALSADERDWFTCKARNTATAAKMLASESDYGWCASCSSSVSDERDLCNNHHVCPKLAILLRATWMGDAEGRPIQHEGHDNLMQLHNGPQRIVLSKSFQAAEHVRLQGVNGEQALTSASLIQESHAPDMISA